MPTIPLPKLNQMARQFAPGLVDKLIAAGTVRLGQTGDELTVSPERLQWICAAFPPLPDPDRWPLCIRLIAAKAQPEDSGVGDTLHRLIGPVHRRRLQSPSKPSSDAPATAPAAAPNSTPVFPTPNPPAAPNILPRFPPETLGRSLGETFRRLSGQFNGLF